MKEDKVSAKVLSAVIILTALKREYGFSPSMVHLTAEYLGIYKISRWGFTDKEIPSKRTISRILKELVGAGLLKREGYKYFASDKLMAFINRL